MKKGSKLCDFYKQYFCEYLAIQLVCNKMKKKEEEIIIYKQNECCTKGMTTHSVRIRLFAAIDDSAKMAIPWINFIFSFVSVWLCVFSFIKFPLLRIEAPTLWVDVTTTTQPLKVYVCVYCVFVFVALACNLSLKSQFISICNVCIEQTNIYLNKTYMSKLTFS